MSYLSIFCLSFTVALSGALMPGPLLTTVIARSAGTGFSAGPLVSLGHALLEGLLLTGLVFGLGGLMRLPVFVITATLAGSFLLITMGIHMLLTLGRVTIGSAKARRADPLKLIADGIVVSAVNPYWSIWWVTIGLGLAMTAGKAGVPGVAVFFCGHILADFLWYSSVSFLVSSRRSFISTKAYRAILCACALALVFFGVYFVIRLPSNVG
ncbi:MAG: LysE family transporter [Deltaproteobacteria bacterium]